MNILFLSPWYPYPPNNGSKLRISNLLSALTKNNQVTLISFYDSDSHYFDLPKFEDNIRAQIIPKKFFNPKSIRAILGTFSPKPRSIIDCHSTDMAKVLSNEIANNRYDIIIASELYTAAYITPKIDLPTIFEDFELGIFENTSGESTTQKHKLRYKLMKWKLYSYLKSFVPRFSACTVVSDREQNLLRNAVPSYKNIEIIPNSIKLKKYVDIKGEPRVDSLIFTGSFTYRVNYQGMVWFMENVYPLLLDHRPEVKITITGDHADLPLPHKEKIELTGLVDDVYPLIVSSSISIAPILVGGGTRLKILEAMALRTPVVTTTKGAEGLDIKSGDHLLIADTPQDFADAILTILNEVSLRKRLVYNAYEIIQKKYDSAVVMPRFVRLVEEIAYSN